jgi:hypothetical protein
VKKRSKSYERTLLFILKALKPSYLIRFDSKAAEEAGSPRLVPILGDENGVLELRRQGFGGGAQRPGQGREAKHPQQQQNIQALVDIGIHVTSKWMILSKLKQQKH